MPHFAEFIDFDALPGIAGVNIQTGITYTYLFSDQAKLVSHANAAAIAGTLPQAGLNFPAGWYFFVQNTGAGTLTITPTVSTIDGAANITLATGSGAIIVSDGANYFTVRGAGGGGSGVTSVSGTAGRISSSGGATPVIDLVGTGVTPGTYPGATVTVDTFGRITAILAAGAALVSFVLAANPYVETSVAVVPVVIDNSFTLTNYI